MIVIDLGFSWMASVGLWAWIITLAFLGGLYVVWSEGGVAAGAAWLRNRGKWVKIYELAEIRLTSPAYFKFGINRANLALKDADGRELSVPLRMLEANNRLWDLVFNGIVHSVERGATIDELARAELIDAAMPLPDYDPAVAEHRAAVTAHHSGDHDLALQHYQRSLLVAEELGDSAGVARASQDLGILLTEVGDAESAIGFTLQSLAIHNDLDSEVDGDLRWLARQRRILGKARFAELLSDSLGESAAGELIEILDELPAT